MTNMALCTWLNVSRICRSEQIILHELPHIDPALEVGRTIQMIHHPTGCQVFEAHLVVSVGFGERIDAVSPSPAQYVVEVAVLPDAGIVDLVRSAEFVIVDVGDHRLTRDGLPIEQKRIVGYGHHQARRALVTIIGGDHPILLYEARARKTVLFGVGVDGVGQIPPVDEILADRVTPVDPPLIGRALIEEVPLPLPVAQTIWIVQPIFWRAEVIEWAVAISFFALA
jgi:hypothetical protein